MPLISLLLPDLRGGGAERVNLDLAHEFARAGHQVKFVLREAQGELLDQASASFDIVDLGCERVRQVPTALADYLRTLKPDAIIASMWPLTVVAPIARALSGHRCKVAILEHNRLSAQYASRERLHRAAMRASMTLGYRMADARIGVSEGVVEDLVNLSGLSRDRFSVIYNPIPLRSVPPPEVLAKADRLWQGKSGARVLAVGSLKEQKNHALLLRAFARMQRRDGRLMLLGTGDLEGELRQLAARMGIADRVIFAGFHPDPTPFYYTADLFALTSDHEGFGNVLVEALACGTPVVSTDCPSGPAEIMRGGEYGKLVPVGDADALALAMEESLAMTHDLERLRARARDFAPDKAARAYLDLLFPSGKGSA